jgi:hypothetical protein
MTFRMVGPSGVGASVQPKAATESNASQPSNRARSHGTSQPASRLLTIRVCILAALVVAYRASFASVHGLIGNPAFLLGLGICLVSAMWFGLRGALVMIVCIALVDRSLARQLPVSLETSRPAAVIALLLKLVLAGGLGAAVDSRRRVLALNTELRRQIEAREQSEQSLLHSEWMQRALV